MTKFNRISQIEEDEAPRATDYIGGLDIHLRSAKHFLNDAVDWIERSNLENTETIAQAAIVHIQAAKRRQAAGV